MVITDRQLTRFVAGGAEADPFAPSVIDAGKHYHVMILEHKCVDSDESLVDFHFNFYSTEKTVKIPKVLPEQFITLAIQRINNGRECSDNEVRCIEALLEAQRLLLTDLYGEDPL